MAVMAWVIAWWSAIGSVFAGEPASLGGTCSHAFSITDAANRTVAIQTPVKRVVAINTAAAIIMRALGVDMPEIVVGVTRYITENPRFWPKLKDKPVFIFTNLNYERLAELKPQLIILYKNSYLTTNENKLAALNIQWLYLDCNDARTIDSDIRTLGRLFNKAKQAEALIAWRSRYARLIAERIGSIDPEDRKPTYFYTFVQNNLNKRIYSTKNERSSCHALIQDAGGINIAANLPQESLQVSGEWLMEQNPAAIVGGVVAKTICGYNADENAAMANLKAFYRQLTADPVLKGTAAVKNKRVLLIAQDLKEGPATVVGTLYVAKFLYPERFADIDPDAVLREYHEKWCGLDHRGVYVYPPLPWHAGESTRHETKKTTLTITDGVGREVAVPYPLTRVAAASGSYGPEAILALGAREALVGVGDYAKMHALHISPLLQTIPGVGLKEPSAEKILEIAPQAVIFYECYYPYPQSLMDALERAGISAIMMDFHAKWLYPDLFRDLDPVAIYRQWMERFLDIQYKGIYAYPKKPVDRNSKNPDRSVSILDSAGRHVTIPQPLQRIAGLQSSGCREFSLLQIEGRVVGVTEYLQGDPGMLPRLAGKPNIGSVYTPNYEIIAQVSPQVVFMGTAAVNLQPAIDKLTPMGIQVVAMDFQPIRGDNALAREAHYDNELLLLGRITGKEARARAFVKWKNGILELIRGRTAVVDKKQVLGINSVSKLLGTNTFTTWAGKRIIELAGGVDPSAGVSAQDVSGEWVLQQNPEVIIVSSYWLTEGLGYGAADTGRVAKVYEKVRRHPVIGQTRAAQSGNLFLFSYYGVASGGQTALGALYLAKRLYPNRFSDVDPETFHKVYFKQWLDVDYRGIWFYP